MDIRNLHLTHYNCIVLTSSTERYLLTGVLRYCSFMFGRPIHGETSRETDQISLRRKKPGAGVTSELLSFNNTNMRKFRMISRLKTTSLLLMYATLQAESFQISYRNIKSLTKVQNNYDDWRADGTVDSLLLSEESVESCLDEFINSDAGKQIFGIHDLPGMI